MGKVSIQQTSFASGELSPSIFGRVDRDVYSNGVAKGRNILITPLGGAKRRSGSKYIDSSTNNSPTRLVPFAFNTDQEYLLVFTAGEFKVYKDDVLQATVNTAPISSMTSDIIQEFSWAQSADTLLLTHPDLPPIRVTRTSHTSWTAVNIAFDNIPQYDFGSGVEDVWSDTKGWPATATFWQQRLWFGGSKHRPQTVWASKISGFFDFDLGTGFDADAIEYTVDNDQINGIVNILAGRSLQVLTSGGEYFTPLVLNTAVTPKTIALERASRHGSSRVRPVNSDGATIFADKSGAVIREYLFLDIEQSYITDDISFLSEHLIQSPVCSALQSSSELSGEYSFWVNSNGTMAVLNRRRAQKFLAWSLWETKGEYEQVAVVDDYVYVTCKRNVNGAEVRFIEKFDSDYYTDAGTILSAPTTTSWGGLGYLEGEDVNVRSQDGYPLLPNTVDSGGIVTEKEQDSIEVGLPWSLVIRTMPPQMGFNSGKNLVGNKRRILSVNFNLLNSNGFVVSTKNSKYDVVMDKLGELFFNKTPNKFTGWKKVYVRGFSREPYIEITQKKPNDLHILSASTEVTT